MQNPFSSITTAGLLLPVDLLTRVGSMDRSLPGMTPADYHIPGSIRLNEAATAAYTRALAYWNSFRKKFDALPASDTGTTLTRDEWLLPLFDCLGYGRLQTKRAISIDHRDYPISHGWEDYVPIHLLSARLPLDKRTQNVSGAATRSPYSLVQELLNRSAKHRWGFVSNGLKLYVLRDNASLTRSANIEFDLETMMEGEYHADFTVLYLICHQSRLEIQPNPIVDTKGGRQKVAKPKKGKKPADSVREKIGRYALDLDDAAELDELVDEVTDEPSRLGPENCWLESWTKLAGEQGTRAKEKLRDGVQQAIQALGAGFYTTVSNTTLHERLRSGELAAQDYYRQLLRLVYRLLMLMVAEDKRTESGSNLLHPIDTPAHIRDRYAQYYSVARIRSLAGERRGTPHRDLYESLKTTFLKLRDGYTPLGIPGIGSFLFSDTATPDLDDAQITNEALLDAFRRLCFTEDTSSRGGSVRRAVDFGNLGAEELGSIYESLLELHPEIDGQDGPFILRTAAGNERKTSGSYYTPTSLINCLLDSALDPVVNAAIDVPDREEAKRRLLDLKVCDPACGSGHFLIAAANRMALHLARLETQDTEPTTLQIQHAKRQIIGRCIYGVDINEMAVELCKVSLWMEALEPGKPFSFLENHIKCGNSLLGATPRLLNEGIPDDAFKPIEGDDKTVCTELKKANKRERTEYKSGQGYLFEPRYKLGNLAAEFAKLTAADDESLDAIADKQKQYEELVKGANYLNARFWADTWCATFVWHKCDTDLGQLCPTERKFREIERSPHSASLLIREEVQRLAEQYQFLHWHLAFPNVFELPDSPEHAINRQAGWSQGFDVVLGNPPWEKINLKDEEFFAESHPQIANASTKAVRKQLLEQLRNDEPSEFAEYQFAKNQHDRISGFFRLSGYYPLTGVSRINLYSVFCETGLRLVAPRGRLGMVLASGIVTDDNNKELFASLIGDRRLIHAWDFENSNGIFPGVHRSFKFLLFSASGIESKNQQADFAFFLTDVSQLSAAERHFTLTSQELADLNPNTRTCPSFRNKREAEITKLIYRRVPAWELHKKDQFWPGVPKTPFNMSNDSRLFFDSAKLRALGEGSLDLAPLYESKFIFQFNHRFATFSQNAEDGTTELELAQLADPNASVTSRYWLQRKILNERFPGHWFFGYRMITNATNERAAVAAIIPECPCAHSLSIVGDLDANGGLVLLSCVNSFVYDYAARQKIAGMNFSHWIWRQLPIIPKEKMDETCYWLSEFSAVRDWLAMRVLELTYTAWDLEAFALDCGYDAPPFQWDEERRFQIRCELDAAYFHLYLGANSEWGIPHGKDESEGVNATLLEMFPTPRDAVSYIMDTFPIVRRKDEKAHGEYRTKRVILETYDQMTAIINTNNALRAANPNLTEAQLRPQLASYQSPLNPPPGPPTDANGNFIPYADWTDEIQCRYADVIHPPRRTVVDWPKLELIRDLLLVLETWQTPASISAIEPTLLLMRDDRARAVLSGRDIDRQLPPGSHEPNKLDGIETIYATLEANQTIGKVGDTAYRLLKTELTAQFPDSLKAKAREAVAIVQSFNEPQEAHRAVSAHSSFDFAFVD